MNIRKECVGRREEDTDEPSHPYCYTTLFELVSILDKKWGDFNGVLPPTMKDKAKTLSRLRRLANLRNRIMHPVRESPPSDEEFAAVNEFRRQLDCER